jgi:hypothetical protein
MAEAVRGLQAVIDAAAALQRWDDLGKAIDFLIECEQVIVCWWDDHVRPAGHQPNNVDLTLFNVKRAEDVIGFRQDQVSRFRTALRDLNAYRNRVEAAARRKAELEVTESHRVNTGEYEWYTPVEYTLRQRAR